MTFDSSVMLMLAVAPFALAMSLSPGPNNIMIAAIAGRYGARRTVPYLFGTLAGVTILMLATGSGLGEVFVRWPTAHAWMKIVGVGYMFWLAWRVATAPVSFDPQAGKAFGFFAALMFQWFNPKAWVMTLGAFSIFTSVGGAAHLETLVITLTVALAFVPAVVLWTVVGLTARRFHSSRRSVAAFNVTMGVLIALSAAAVLI